MLRKGNSPFLFGWKFPPRKMGSERGTAGVHRCPPGEVIAKEIEIWAPSVGLLVHTHQSYPNTPHIPVHTFWTTVKRAEFLTIDIGNDLCKSLPSGILFFVIDLFSCLPHHCCWLSLPAQFPPADIFKSSLSRH